MRAIWKPGTFGIDQRGFVERTPVAGWVSPCGYFGIHQRGIVAKRVDPYTLTHIPTGLQFGLEFRTRAEAELAASRFAAIPVDWASTDPAVVATPAECKALYRSMRAYPLYKDTWKYANPYPDPLTA